MPGLDQIKSGHDERVSRSERRERFAQAPTSFSNSVVVFRHSFTAPRRDAPELCMNPSPKEGVGNAGCPLHPQPRVRFALVKSTRVNEYTGITRRSRTQWFYDLFRALPGDRALLPPSPADMVLSKPGRADLTSANLTPASGRQDHTTSPYATTSLVRVLSIAHKSFDPPCNSIARKTLPRPPHPTPRP